MKKSLLGLYSLLLIAFGCSSDLSSSNIPDIYVRETVILANQEALPLRFDGGVIYITGGVRGIMVYRENASTYKAFDRACPNNPTATCELLRADDSKVFMIDTCCKSQFDWNGYYLGGPARGVPRQYATALVNGTLYIDNNP